MEACGLFAGIGGLELGLGRHGIRTSAFCEIDPHAQLVLAAHFPHVSAQQRRLDILELSELPRCDVVTAGFPCQDLSMAGQKLGIRGQRSGLVTTLFELLDKAERPPEWLLVENVPFMLHLDRGEAMRFLTAELERMGWRWAYRVVDARAFGLPQRRLRVILLASRQHDPRPLLFAQDAEPLVNDSTHVDKPDVGYGFYWTEGRRGLGWAVDGVPTIKGGSSLGIPSPPAIWDRPADLVGLPDIRDLERLQGFPAGFTEPALQGPGRNRGARYRLVGNAVCVDVAAWVASRLVANGSSEPWPRGAPLPQGAKWPRAAWGGRGERPHAVPVSTWPEAAEPTPLLEFLREPLAPLSLRATRGYLSRLDKSTSLHVPAPFRDAICRHLERMQEGVAS